MNLRSAPPLITSPCHETLKRDTSRRASLGVSCCGDVKHHLVDRSVSHVRSGEVRRAGHELDSPRGSADVVVAQQGRSIRLRSDHTNCRARSERRVVAEESNVRCESGPPIR